MALRKIVRLVDARATSDGAGVRLRRSIGTPELDHLDPFLLLDEFKSQEASDYIGGFPDHPHRGFETVTYMLAGAMEHRDHRGNRGQLVAGGVQWMTAGRGIIHSEMPQQVDGLMWGFQLWVNLPRALKMSEPRYQDVPPEGVPRVELAGGVVERVIAGRAAGVEGAIRGAPTDPLYVDVWLPPKTRFEHPIGPGHNAFVYLFEGRATVGRTAVEAGLPLGTGRLAVLGNGDAVAVDSGASPARFLLVAAEPIGEPIVRHGPFVMNTQEEILQAVRDYQQGVLQG